MKSEQQMGHLFGGDYQEGQCKGQNSIRSILWAYFLHRTTSPRGSPSLSSLCSRRRQMRRLIVSGMFISLKIENAMRVAICLLPLTSKKEWVREETGVGKVVVSLQNQEQHERWVLSSAKPLSKPKNRFQRCVQKNPYAQKPYGRHLQWARVIAQQNKEINNFISSLLVQDIL